MNDYNSHILPITRENGFKQPRNLVCLTMEEVPCQTPHDQPSLTTVMQLTTAYNRSVFSPSYPTQITSGWTAYQLLMQECLFSEPPGLEREPTWKPHQEVMPTTHSPILLPPTLYLFLVYPHDFISFSSCPSPPLPFMPEGEWGGGGRFPCWIFCQLPLGLLTSGSFAGYHSIFHDNETVVYSCMGKGQSHWRID